MPTKFYDNLRRIQFLVKVGVLIQYSVFMTEDQRAAYSVRDLVQHYEGLVALFKGKIIE